MMKKDGTLEYYEANAADFAAGTVAVDFTDTQNRFMRLLAPGARILDFGCGAGRDTKCFLDAGYAVDAVDGSAELCRLASEYTGIEVKQQLFQELSAQEVYDGIWACASILHLPKDELMPVLVRMAQALKPGGMIYTSFKYGDFEGERNGRYFTYFTEDSWAQFTADLKSLATEEYWITSDVRPGRDEEKWLNLILRK